MKCYIKSLKNINTIYNRMLLRGAIAIVTYPTMISFNNDEICNTQEINTKTY